MTLNKAKGRMFKSVGWTWNPITGCSHECPYCWAKSLSERYGRSFEPKLNISKLLDKLPDDGTWIFLGSMGDLFCYGFDSHQIYEVLNVLECYKGSNKFLLQTKNPVRAINFIDQLTQIKDKIIIGTTIETNRDTPGNAPKTQDRYAAMVFFKKLEFKTFLSLEPLADFDIHKMIDFVLDVHPEAVEMGLENYTNYLPKPSEFKISDLYEFLKENEINIVLKENLAYLDNGEQRREP